MAWRDWWQRQRHRRTALILGGVAGVVIAMGGWPIGVFGSSDSPACDDAGVVRSVVATFNLHPDYIARTTLMTGLREIRQVEFRRHPRVNASANTRWCEGVGRFANGESETVYYDLFATRTILGAAYGVRACFGRLDPRHRDCSFARPPKD